MATRRNDEVGPKDGTLILSAEDVRRLVAARGLDFLMDEVIDELTIALAGFEDGELEVLPRVGFAYESPHLGVLEWMPTMKRGDDIIIKVVAENPGNPERFGLPTIVASISRYEVSTGRLLGIMDGVFPTALRTGAASAVASRILARPDSSVIGLIGCGAQAVTQLHALSRVFPVQDVLVWDPEPVALDSFGERVAFTGLRPRATSLEVLEAEAHILCTATTVAPGAGPVLAGVELAPFVHVNAIGSDMPGKIELPIELLRSSLVCPDFLEQAVVEGECQQLAREEIGPSLPAIVREAERYQARRDGRTVFDSTGFALEDKVVFEVIARHALEMSLGQVVGIENIPSDPRNPYAFGSSPPSRAEGSAGDGIRRSWEPSITSGR